NKINSSNCLITVISVSFKNCYSGCTYAVIISICQNPELLFTILVYVICPAMNISIITFNISLPSISILIITFVLNYKNFSYHCTEYNFSFSIKNKINKRKTADTKINWIRNLKVMNRIKVIYDGIIFKDVNI